MEFQHPEMFICFLTLPLIWLVWLYMLKWKKRSIRKFSDESLFYILTRNYSRNRPAFKFILLFVAMTFIILALVNPRIGSKYEKVKRKGVDIAVCIDVSNSMKACDIKPSRLDRAKMAVSKLIDRMEGDQVGIIVFAGKAQVQLPITPDYAGAKLFLNTISTDIFQAQGTAIGSAIELASASFNMKSRPRKVIILISDGENHEDDAITAAASAASKGIVIHVVGMGSPEGTPIPIVGTNNNIEFKKDKKGNTVITKLDEIQLKKIAATGKGIYVRASDSDVGLNKIYDEIDKMQQEEYEAVNYADYENFFPYLTGFALLIILLEIVVLERKTKLTRNLKLFSKPASDYVVNKSDKNVNNKL